MERLVEYLNPHPHNVQLIGPDKRQILVPPKGKVVLSDWFIGRYCPKDLHVVKILGGNRPVARIERALHSQKSPRGRGIIKVPLELNTQLIQQAPAPISAPVPAAPIPIRQPKQVAPPNQLKEHIKRQIKIQPPQPMPVPKRQAAAPVKLPPPVRTKPVKEVPRKSFRDALSRRPIGRSKTSGADSTFSSVYNANEWAISNGIGVGILSYNRLDSLQRLIASIKAHTDLSRVTVFVSDESTDPAVGEWLRQQRDIVALTNQSRLGVAGNSNRLLRCLSRFRYCFLLNDDAEILADNWDQFYIQAQQQTGYHHFCFRQIGLIGAQHGITTTCGHWQIDTITEKPHGAVLFFTHETFRRVGFFDHSFGIYGMEHVDWSNRVGLSGLQAPGFHDVFGSDRYFKVHKEHSAAPEKATALAAARIKYQTLSQEANRVHVDTNPTTEVPSISVIIPIRNTGRDGAIETVIESIRAQLFPDIDIVVVEQDSEVRTAIDKFRPCTYQLAQSRSPDQPFTKSVAFNLGVSYAKHNDIILHDADMIATRLYVRTVYNQLREFEGLHIGRLVLYLNKTSSENVISSGHIDHASECERVVDYYEGGSLACKRIIYESIGGFNETYEGYGVEDCDFFERLKHCSKFNNERTQSLIHLWHGRTPGWEDHHDRNKRIKADINQMYGISDKVTDASPRDVEGLKAYAATLSKLYRIKYGQVTHPDS